MSDQFPSSFLIRSQARDAAIKQGFSGFRTVLIGESQMWKLQYEPGESPAAAWAKGKDFVAWCESTWREDAMKRPVRVGVIIVTCTMVELADENVPAEFLIEPITPELFEPERPTTGRRNASAPVGSQGILPPLARAKSDVESPVKTVWRIADEMKGASRADVVSACVAAGVNKATASTQFYRWAKAKGD